MLCQNCHKNEATIHLYTSVNGQRTEINLCQNCYQKLRNQANEGMNNMAQNPNGGFSSFEDLFNALNGAQQPNAFEPQGPQTQTGGGNGNGRRPRGNGVLDQYGVDLTDLAKQGQIDPLVGRDKETNRVIVICNRRTKTDPVLIGEAGVGKTAVVEGLAQKIVDGDVPEKLQNKHVVRLDVVSLVQGTGVRGQFEQRMQQLINEP